MAGAVAGATSGWGHLPFLAPRLVIGFLYVFLIFAIPWNWYLSAGTVANPNLPFNVFLQYWNWIALDPNHLWFAVVASLLVGFFVSDFITYWNYLVLRIMDALRIKKPLAVYLSALATNLSPEFKRAKERIADVDGTKHTESMSDAGFRVWLFSHANGAPVKFLDWHGFNTDLANRTYQALFFFFQAWIIWGVVGLSWVSKTGSWNIWLTQPQPMFWAFLEWLVVLLAGFFLASTAYLAMKLWGRILASTWVSLYAFWKEEKTRDHATKSS